MEYYDTAVLWKIGNHIGKTLKVDRTTSVGMRGNYARICVEVDLTKPLLSKFKLRRRIRRISYEGLHMICFGCGQYGHKHDMCPFSMNKEDRNDEQQVSSNNGKGRDPTVPAEDTVVRPEVAENYGQWMVARRVGRKFSMKTDSNQLRLPQSMENLSQGGKRSSLREKLKETAIGGGSRFNALNGLYVESHDLGSRELRAEIPGPSKPTGDNRFCKETIDMVNFKHEERIKAQGKWVPNRKHEVGGSNMQQTNHELQPGRKINSQGNTQLPDHVHNERTPVQKQIILRNPNQSASNMKKKLLTANEEIEIVGVLRGKDLNVEPFKSHSPRPPDCEPVLEVTLGESTNIEVSEEPEEDEDTRMAEDEDETTEVLVRGHMGCT
ncbi:hypothetical protein NC652_017734 [Populus alba x Populus x berolinensis]|nr:hypothetical protein NC652_017734 [Populus alba x Populus x berolinensis]